MQYKLSALVGIQEQKLLLIVNEIIVISHSVKYLNSRIYNLRFWHKYENKCITLMAEINFRK